MSAFGGRATSTRVAFPIKGDKSNVALWWNCDSLVAGGTALASLTLSPRGQPRTAATPRDPLELVRSTVLETDPRARDEIPDGARNEHFSRLGLGGDPRSDRDGDAGDLALGELALARM
jgi:hypothetical protein